MRIQPATGQAKSDASATDSASPGAAGGSNGAHPAAGDPSDGTPVRHARGSLNGNGAGSWRARRRDALALIGKIPSLLRVNWLVSILLAGGVVLRVLAQMAYHPAIIYIDTLKYRSEEHKSELQSPMY